MRIIGGVKKGCQLLAPKGMDTRPTKDNVREAVFGSIQFDIYGSNFLDLFSGSGAIGLEALSRGAGFTCFSDVSKYACNIIYKNIAKAGFLDRYCLINKDYKSAIDVLSGKYLFDFVYVDPPYSLNLYENVLSHLHNCHILEKKALIVLESDCELEIGSLNYDIIKKKRYGKCHITFMRYNYE